MRENPIYKLDDLGGSTILGSPHIDVDIFGLFGPTIKPLWQWMNFWAVHRKSRQVWETAGSTKTMQNSMGKVTTQARRLSRLSESPAFQGESI